MLTIDLEQNPGLQFRIDSFEVPAKSRDEFVEAVQRNMAFIETLPGFLGHFVSEKTSGPTAFNLATIAVWKNAEAVEAAGKQVREYYKRIGFDVQATLSRLGVTASIGEYVAPAELQRAHLHLPRTAVRSA
jgi:heme-degrading monooxygenase HmoA